MMRRTLAGALTAALLFAGCSSAADEPVPDDLPSGQQAQPPEDLPAADDAAARLAAALEALDVSQLPMQSAAASAQEELETLVSGMDGVQPEVTVATVGYVPEERAAKLALDITMPVADEPWTYESEATLKWVDDDWRLVWSSAVLHPDLTSKTRLRRTLTKAPRAAIQDDEGLALVEEITLYEVGLDKASADRDVWEEAARHLADVLDIDADAYAEQVLAGGDQQFVIAQRLRLEEVPAAIIEVPGALSREVQASVGPSPTFAASILGAVGNPTAEMIEESDEPLSPYETVGLSGLQYRYEERLRGTPMVAVDLVPRDPADAAETPERELFRQEQTHGTPLRLSLDRELQTEAERVLSEVSGTAAIVALDVHDGGVKAAALSPDAGVYPYATVGQYAPGSTFKMVSALAMLRSGKHADSRMECPAEHVVDGQTFRNHSGFAHTGTLTLADAIAYSCNTVFTRASAEVSNTELQEAAASLGVGQDHDAGFSSFFGVVEPVNDIDRAASMIGQGQVLMSPLAMATVAASVAKGATVVPWLVEGEQASSTAAPLTEEEAAELRAMMAATVDHGTGTSLQGVVRGAKSGTAEWGPAGEQQTHAWMIAYTDDLALAAFVEVGDSGGAVAAPLIRDLLS